ncbi:TRAP transporter substrate-binding protein DctP [Antarctobacter sp.]|uniref:TRAP transporter substrate-binding protein DctP n=1 Tax=Antarctobacter sp. TaxID=1872577 RepID=UPI003A8CD627
MVQIHKATNTLAAATLITTFGAGAALAELDRVKFEVVTGNHVDTFTQELALPFFNEWLAERSDGKITGNAVPYTELGLSGYEIMNLLKLGTNDISNSVIGYMSSDSPNVEGLELPGLTGDLTLFREAQAAYRPLIARELSENWNARLLLFYTHPKLQAFCNLPESEAADFSLDTIQDKKIRVHSTSFADFVEGMGAVPVTMSFADVIPSLERGVLDCAITSPTAAYGSGMFQVTNYVVDIPAGYSTQLYAMNNDTWTGLNDETQAFLTEQFAELEQQLHDMTDRDTAQSAACLGDGPCERGKPGGMGLLTLSEADGAALKEVVESTVLTRWTKRCGAECATEWNETMGAILGMTAQ